MPRCSRRSRSMTGAAIQTSLSAGRSCNRRLYSRDGLARTADHLGADDGAVHQLDLPRLDLAVVEPHQHVALGNDLALAVAEIDDAVAKQARDLGLAHRLDATGGIDDLDRGAARGRHRRDLRSAPEAPPAGSRRKQ